MRFCEVDEVKLISIKKKANMCKRIKSKKTHLEKIHMGYKFNDTHVMIQN